MRRSAIFNGVVVQMAVYRFLEYRTALWVGGPRSLEAELRSASAALGNNTQRIVERADGASVMGLRIEDTRTLGMLVHCARYVNDQPTSVVSMVEQPAAMLGQRRPGNAENFVQSDFMAAIHGNHVVSLNAGQKAASLREYLRGLFRLAGLQEESGMFDLVRMANINVAQKIRSSGGVASLEVDLALQEAAYVWMQDRRQRRAQQRSRMGAMRDRMADLVGDIFADDRQGQGIATSRKGTVRMVVSVPSGDLQPAKVSLDQTTMDLLEDEETGYVVRLRNGDTIRPEEASLRKRIRLEREGNSVNALAARDEILRYMSELSDDGHMIDE